MSNDATGKGPLGLVAGGGTLPQLILDRCRRQGRSVYVLALKGYAAPDLVSEVPHAWIRLGGAREALSIAHREGIRELVIAGRVARPSLTSLMPDSMALKIIGKAGLRLGDDGLLRAIANYLEREEGMKILAVQDVLDNVLPNTPGPMGRHTPDSVGEQDIARGMEVLDALSAADVGQAAVVQDGVVLGVEAAEGTDELIRRTGSLAREGEVRPVLIKRPKRGQEQRLDFPTVGPETISRAYEAGFAGIAIEVHGTLLVERDRLIELADTKGLFVQVIVERASK